MTKLNRFNMAIIALSVTMIALIGCDVWTTLQRNSPPIAETVTFVVPPAIDGHAANGPDANSPRSSTASGSGSRSDQSDNDDDDRDDDDGSFDPGDPEDPIPI